MKYSILMVVHGQYEMTRTCLDAIYRHSKLHEFEVLILDNASPDQTLAFLQSEANKKGNIRVFQNDVNGGFMTPMNYLASEAKGDFLVVLNNDVIVCEGWLSAMKAKFDGDDKMALVGVAGNCGEIGPNGEGLPVRHGLEYVEASCMMMRRSIFEKHGLFDDQYYFFGYYEDSDLSLRLRERGYHIAVVPLNIIHRRASTMNKLRLDLEGIKARNAELFRRRWANYLMTRTFARRILFNRSSALGDVIMAVPIVRAYRERFPLAKITFSTRCPQAFDGNPYVDKVIDLNAMQIDISAFDEFYNLDLAYERKPQIPVINAYAEAVGISVNGHRPRLYAAKQNGKDHRLAVIHADRIPGWPGRSAPVKLFAEAAASLRLRGFRVVEVGSTQSIPGIVEYRKTTFAELCALISSASIFVGQDSAPFHVAQAYDVPAVVPFGSIKPELRDHSGLVFPVMARQVGCLGCHHIQSPPLTVQKCLRQRPVCMESISGIMMERAIDAAIGRRANV